MSKFGTTKIKTFQDLRQSINQRVVYLRKQSDTSNRNYVKTGKLADRLTAVKFASELEAVEQVINSINSLERI